MKQSAFTIFGGTGDLTFRKLLPALYNLSVKPNGGDAQIIIIGRRDYTSAQYRAIARDWVKQFARLPYTDEKYDLFAARLHYYQMDFTDLTAYPALGEYYRTHGVIGHIFYLAVAPRFFGVIAAGLAAVEGASAGKVVLEKPFGDSLSSAAQLNAALEKLFTPERIYRIDHYLGKEMVRNIQTIRFMNPIFSDIFDKDHIECIELSALEDVGVETRGGYYDESGALRDMVQNHLFQVLSIVAMEQPVEFSGPDMKEKQLAVLHALRTPDEETIAGSLVLGQYDGYRQEPLVDPTSSTETYAALRLFVDNDRWRGMPFYIRTGKKLGKRETEVAIVFKKTDTRAQNDILLIKIQPTEGIYLQFNIKRPGDTDEITVAKMDFCQSCSLENRANTPEAYERLLTACMRGEQAWFSGWEQIELSWNFIDHLLSLYSAAGLPLHPYKAGERGPGRAEELLGENGHTWFETD